PPTRLADGGRAQRHHFALESARRSDARPDDGLLPSPVGREEAEVAGAVGGEEAAARGEGRIGPPAVLDARLGRVGPHRRAGVTLRCEGSQAPPSWSPRSYNRSP